MRIAKLHPLYKLIRRFRMDLLGYMLTRPSPVNKYTGYLFTLINSTRKSWWERTKRYIYRLDIVKPQPKIKRLKNWFITRQLALFTFPMFNRKQFITVHKKALKTEGSIESTFIRYIEGTLVGMLYRMQVYSNIFDIYKFVNFGFVMINNKVIDYPKQVIAVGSIVTVSKDVKELLRLNKLSRVVLKRHLFNRPRYMYISHKFLFGLIFRNIKKRDLTYRYKNIDIFRGADLSK